MLLLLVLSTAAIFCPALSQPARSDVFEEGDYPFPLYRGRVEWGEAFDRPHKAMGHHPHITDVANMLRDFQAMRMASMYPQQGRLGKSADPSGVPPFKAKRFDSLRMAGGEKRNFDEIDRSGFNSFIKKNFDEIDRSGFNSLIKKNFDEIDRNGFNSLVKRSASGFESSNH